MHKCVSEFLYAKCMCLCTSACVCVFNLNTLAPGLLFLWTRGFQSVRRDSPGVCGRVEGGVEGET